MIDRRPYVWQTTGDHNAWIDETADIFIAAHSFGPLPLLLPSAGPKGLGDALIQTKAGLAILSSQKGTVQTDNPLGRVV